MNNEKLFAEYLATCLSQIKNSEIQTRMSPEELKSIFKQSLAIKNPYWQLNPDSDKLTKIGLIFKPMPTYVEKGKPIYTALLFNGDHLEIVLEEQYTNNANTFKISYRLIFNNWSQFQEQLMIVFTKAHQFANGTRI